MISTRAETEIVGETKKTRAKEKAKSHGRGVVVKKGLYHATEFKCSKFESLFEEHFEVDSS